MVDFRYDKCGERITMNNGVYCIDVDLLGTKYRSEKKLTQDYKKHLTINHICSECYAEVLSSLHGDMKTQTKKSTLKKD